MVATACHAITTNNTQALLGPIQSATTLCVAAVSLAHGSDHRLCCGATSRRGRLDELHDVMTSTSLSASGSVFNTFGLAKASDRAHANRLPQSDGVHVWVDALQRVGPRVRRQYSVLHARSTMGWRRSLCVASIWGISYDGRNYNAIYIGVQAE